MIPTSVIIPQRGHQRALTEPLVASIRRWEPEAEILVVDDGEGFRKSTGDIEGARVLNNDGRGLTAAWNLGCRKSRGDFLVLLNNDVICTGPFLEKLQSRAGQGIAGVIMRPDPDLKIYLLEGWCLAFSALTFAQLGGLDERFHLYFSDTDLQYRAHKTGLPLTSVSLSTLRHLGHRTAHDRSILSNRQEVWQQDQDAFYEKWGLSQ